MSKRNGEIYPERNYETDSLLNHPSNKEKKIKY